MVVVAVSEADGVVVDDREWLPVRMLVRVRVRLWLGVWDRVRERLADREWVRVREGVRLRDRRVGVRLGVLERDTPVGVAVGGGVPEGEDVAV